MKKTYTVGGLYEASKITMDRIRETSYSSTYRYDGHDILFYKASNDHLSLREIRDMRSGIKDEHRFGQLKASIDVIVNES